MTYLRQSLQSIEVSALLGNVRELKRYHLSVDRARIRLCRHSQQRRLPGKVAATQQWTRVLLYLGMRVSVPYKKRKQDHILRCGNRLSIFGYLITMRDLLK